MQVDVTSTASQTWRAFIQADVLLLSKSSFSYVPPAFNRNVVLAPKYVLPLFPNIVTVVDDSVTKTSDKAVKKLVEEQCN